MNSKLKVAVLTGGIGSEREISIQSGRCVSQALRDGGFDVVTADIQPDNLEILEDNSIDVFFPALHGKFGEDGRLQQILHDKSLVYTGSGPAASRLAFDKMASKKLFSKDGVATPAAVEFNTESDINQLEIQLRYLADEYVVKPIREGSSVGVRIVTDMQKVISAAQETLEEFGDCMIEQFIPGKEITVGILEDAALPIIEIRSQTGFYDYQAKYIDDQTEYLFDTIRDFALRAQIEQAAMDCFCALGCRNFARVDFILSDEEIAYVLEVNTIPGFTTHSLLPKAAAKAGFTMSDLCSKIVETACSPLVRRQA
ncbi:MAG: D-alanine--D-alanine ligase [Planctomycetes bacterium]|nr:D-alanine--D-alanine ligase [Planctomycetota bacterium]